METIQENSVTINANEKPVIKDFIHSVSNAVFTALQYYSNVHRGSGQKSLISTRLLEEARKIVLDHARVNKKEHIVIFCSGLSVKNFTDKINSDHFKVLSSNRFGLQIDMNAIIVKKNLLNNSFQGFSGGGTARLIGFDWIVWSNGAAKFEAGTPAVINIIAFTKALQWMNKAGLDKIPSHKEEKPSSLDQIFTHQYAELSSSELLNKIKSEIIGKDALVPTINGNTRYINLDHSASTPAFSTVYNAYKASWFVNYNLKREILEHVRNQLANFLNAPLDSYDIVFTSNTTEGVNILSEYFHKEFDKEEDTLLFSSVLEHSSNDLPWRKRYKDNILRLSVDPDGFFDLKELESKLKLQNIRNNSINKPIELVSLSGASNVHGTCQEIQKISEIVHHYGAKLIVDAAQLIAHKAIDMETSGIDYLVFSGHKLYAPFGSGALIARKMLINPQSNYWISAKVEGEENIAGIAALGQSVAILNRIGMDTIEAFEQNLTTRLLNGLKQVNKIKLYGVQSTNHPRFNDKLGVIPFDLKGIIPTTVGKKLALLGGIGIRTGCHCAHILVKQMAGVGPGLEKFQRLIVKTFQHLQLPGVARVSIGLENSGQDIEKLIESLQDVKNISSSQYEKAKIANEKFMDQIVKEVF